MSALFRQVSSTALTAAALLAGACGDDDPPPSVTDQAQAPAEHGLTPDQAGTRLAKIGDTEITVGDFAEQLAAESPYLRARYNNRERRREYFENFVRFRLLALEAKRRGYDASPAVQKARKRQMVQQMMRELFEERIRISDISDEEIRTYYEAHRDEYAQPEQRRASHILLKNRGLATRLLGQLQAQSLDDDSLFRTLSQRHDEDPITKGREGDLRFFSRQSEPGEDETRRVPDSVAEAAFALEEIGEFAPTVIRSADGFHIVRLTGRRPALRRSLEEARRPIQSKLHRERREAAIDSFVADLRERATIEENYELLGQLAIEAPVKQGPIRPSPPPTHAFPNGEP